MTELDIGWLFTQGDGGARHGKRTVAVPGALPGERVKVKLPKDRGPAELVEVVQASEQRREPPCPVDARCGGCDLSHAEPSARLGWLADSLARSLRLDSLPVVASERPDTRARIKLRVDGGRVGYRAARSHDLVAIDRCRIARPEVNAVIERLNALAPEAFAEVETIELRSDGERCVADVHGKRVSEALREALVDVALNGRVVAGDPTLWLSVAGLSLRASPGTFFQVNAAVNEALVSWVVEQCAGATTVADLYAGIGNFTLPLAAAGHSVRSVELNGPATHDLKASAEQAGLSDRIEAVIGNADRYDPTSAFVDAMVLDPPRRGCPELMRRIPTARTPRVVLVSCDPRSAMRDTQILAKAGYRLVSAQAFDLFVDSHHLELATCWAR